MISDRPSNPSRLLAISVALISCLWLNACLKVDVAFNRTGGGTMKLVMSDIDPAGHERMKKKLTSPTVKLLSAELDDKKGTYEISFEDAKRLRTAPLLAQLRVQHSGLDTSRRTVSLTLPRHEKPESDKEKKHDDNYVAIDLTVVVPGTVAETNGKKVSESTSNWQIRVADMFGEGRIGARTIYDLNDAAAARQAPSEGDKPGGTAPSAGQAASD